MSIRPGTVLVLPGQTAPARYTVVAGDTLAGIAAALAVRGGWPALYAANRRVIGPDPNMIRPGTVLTVPRPAAPSPPASEPGPPAYPAPPSSAPAGSGHRPLPARTGAPAAAGMPRWLKTMLLAAGLLIGAAFLAEPVLVLRRRRAATRAAAGMRLARASRRLRHAARRGPAGRQGRGACRGEARIVLADYDRVVVTRSPDDGTVYVLRPPGQDPRAILRAARLVLPEDLYRELAGQLGLPASWPIVLADYDRLVVTYSARDGAVYVLRPPGAGSAGDLAGGPAGAAGGSLRGAGRAAGGARRAGRWNRGARGAAGVSVPARPGPREIPRSRGGGATGLPAPLAASCSAAIRPARRRDAGPRASARRCWRSGAPAPGRPGPAARPGASS